MKLNCKLIATTITFIILTTNMYAQDYSFKDYDWDNKKAPITIPENYKNEKEVVLFRNIKIELDVKGKEVKQYYLIHEKTYINSNDAIERNNKIYIPFKMDESAIVTKLRVIQKDGKRITLDKKDIKEEVDEEKQLKYNYFAITGLDIGSVIEKIFILAEIPDLDGKTFRMQSNVPIAQNEFQLIFPKHLKFKTKSYNGLPEPILEKAADTLKNVIKVADQNIVALEDDEKYSNRDVNLKLFRYKLDENYYSGAKNINSFSKFTSNFYDRINPILDKKQLKAVEDFCSQIPKTDNLQEQIWNIENKIKKSITYNIYAESNETITDIIKTKQANKVDLLKIYMSILKQYKIETKVVLASDRFNIPFDKDFESYENLDEALLYFPGIKKYLIPTEIEYRIPLFPDKLGNNNGLFISEKIFGGVGMGISEIGFIELPGAEVTNDVMDITADFTEDIENPKITTIVSFGGYSALNFQPIKDYVPADQFQKILKSIADNYTLDAEYTSLKTENDGVEFIGKKPYIMKISFDGKELIQNAGGNYLFSVGKLIGSQMELYQENKRVLPIEIDHPHSYVRNIIIKLPKGTKTKNLEKFVMDFKTQINNKTVAGFISNYSEKDNTITIINNEFYNSVDYPLNKFEEYKNVINAAADFNKIVIILSKN
ncbi:DUF3857 domain-containing protein [Flavobacterium sp.]|jgi:hypothetical protein|uniref:DUF3857 domain-containing protein n=1 Tax=Flavobacterium sp. TaxID=239 RepID=UPI0037C00E56